MKKFLTYLLLTFVFSVLGYKANALVPHPRLFLDRESSENIIAKVEDDADGILARLHSLIIDEADRILDSPQLTYQKDKSGKRILEVSREAMSRILSCAYAYRITSDPEYLNRAEVEMIAVCSFPDWNHSHYLDVAEMAMGVSVGYDWLYDDLKPQTKALAQHAITKYAFDTFEGQMYNTKFLKMSTNWNQVCCAGLITAALAFYETDPERCEAIINTCVESNKRQAVHIYAPDGAFPEGINYWNYGTAYQCILIGALESATGSDRGVYDALGAFSRTGEFYIYQESGASDSVFNFYDNIDLRLGAFPLWYLAARQNSPSLLYGELGKIVSGDAYLNIESVRFLPLVVMGYAQKMDLSQIFPPEEEVYSAAGKTPLVVVKKGWDKSVTSRYVALKGGCCGDSHGHMDAGSFVFDAAGVRWACDIDRPEYEVVEYAMAQHGYGYWPRKEDSKRWTLNFVNNRYHNTLTVNGKNHSVEGRGTLAGTVCGRKRSGGTMDLSKIYPDDLHSWIRTVCLDRRGDLIVEDCVEARDDAPAIIEWRMVTKADVSVRKNGIRLILDGREALLTVDKEVEYMIFEKGPMMPYDVLELNEYNIIGFKTELNEKDKIQINTKIKLL